MTDSDHYTIPRHEWPALLALLDEIPGVVDDLAITITRQDRHATGPRVSRGDNVQPTPFNEHAADAADMLNGELAKWVRRTATARRLTRPSTDNTLALARWLRRWHVALALTPDADRAPGRIKQAIRECRRMSDSPKVVEPLLDWARTEEAREDLRTLELNPEAIKSLCKELGEPWDTITLGRLEILEKADKIKPLRVLKIEGKKRKVYQMGKVMDAHLGHPQRKRIAV